MSKSHMQIQIFKTAPCCGPWRKISFKLRNAKISSLPRNYVIFLSLLVFSFLILGISSTGPGYELKMSNLTILHNKNQCPPVMVLIVGVGAEGHRRVKVEGDTALDSHLMRRYISGSARPLASSSLASV
jgi:hypothetical protein